MDKEAKNEQLVEDGAKLYSGVATDIAEDCEVSAEMVDEETRTLNNNPRNND